MFQNIVPTYNPRGPLSSYFDKIQLMQFFKTMLYICLYFTTLPCNLILDSVKSHVYEWFIWINQTNKTVQSVTLNLFKCRMIKCLPVPVLVDFSWFVLVLFYHLFFHQSSGFSESHVAAAPVTKSPKNRLKVRLVTCVLWGCNIVGFLTLMEVLTLTVGSRWWTAVCLVQSLTLCLTHMSSCRPVPSVTLEKARV